MTREALLERSKTIEIELISRIFFQIKFTIRASTLITADDFSHYGKAYSLILKSHIDNKNITTEFKQAGIDVTLFLNDTMRPVEHICKDLKNISNAIRIHTTLVTASDSVTYENIDSFVSEVQRDIMNAVKSSEKENTSMSVIAQDWKVLRDSYIEKIKNGNPLIGVSSGYDKIDKVIDGLRPGHLWIMGGYTSMGKCHQKGTRILMYSGDFKNVEDMQVGDIVMGVDSHPRTVTSLAHGFEDMYKISPRSRESFVVNKNHILSLKRTGTSSDKKNNRKGELVNITVEDYLKSSISFKHRHKLWSTKIDFKEQSLDIDPYFMGLWLGDGNKESPRITTADNEIINYVNDFASLNNMKITKSLPSGKSNTYHISRFEETGKNKILDKLKSYDVINNKHIPKEYIVNSEENRLQLLAGLIDSDGSKNESSYEFTNTSEQIAKDVCYIARTLGLYASIKERNNVTNYSSGNTCISYRVVISGDVNRIPVKIERKKISINRMRNPLTYNFDVNAEGFGEYFGFQIDGDHLYFTENLIVQHNTFASLNIVANLIKQGKRVVYYSIEMTSADIVSRIIGIMTRQNGKSLIKGYGNQVTAETAMQELIKTNLSIHTTKSSLAEIQFSMYEENLTLPVDMFCVDYMQLVQVKGMSEYAATTLCAIEFQQMAKRLGVPTMLLSQISNDGAKVGSDVVMSFKGSGAIAAAADLAIEITMGEEDAKEWKRKLQAGEPVKMKWNIRKNRHGAVGFVDMKFVGNTGIFEQDTDFDDF